MFNNFKIKSNSSKKKFQILFFLIFLISGLFTVKDYGISYDELEYRQQGFIVLNYLGKKFFPDKTKKIQTDRYLVYPTFVEYLGEVKNNFKIHHTFFAALEFALFKNTEKKNVYLMRHYMNFMMSILMTIFFYKLVRLSFSREISLIGVVILILNPKIFPDYIYNPNDIWFSFFLIISIYCCAKFFKKSKLVYFFFLPIFIALAINVRIIGIYVYFIFLIIFFYLCYKKDMKFINFLKHLPAQILILLISLYFFTPQIWTNGFMSLFDLFVGQLKYNPINPEIMFLGEFISASEVGWYYLPIWIFISTPLIYILLFFFGTFFLAKALIADKYQEEHLSYYLLLGYFFLPLFSYFFFKPIIFNGWRHFYFLYPALVYISLYGLNYLYKISINLNFRNLILIIRIIICVYFAIILLWSYKNHPYQNVYLNYFSKKYSDKFEKDYWGLTNLNAIKYILLNDKRNKIVIVGVENSRIDFSMLMLNQKEKDRIILKKKDEVDPKEVDYYISHFNDKKDVDYYIKNGFKIIKALKIDDEEINIIFTN
jgi:hypothetical protein